MQLVELLSLFSLYRLFAVDLILPPMLDLWLGLHFRLIICLNLLLLLWWWIINLTTICFDTCTDRSKNKYCRNLNLLPLFMNDSEQTNIHMNLQKLRSFGTQIYLHNDIWRASCHPCGMSFKASALVISRVGNEDP